MNRIRGAFIFLAFAGLMTSPAFSNVEERIKFWDEFKEKLKEANDEIQTSPEEQKKKAFEKFHDFLETRACAKNRGFRADLGLLCFNPKIQMIANFYCTIIIKTPNWSKTACATAGKSFWRNTFRSASIAAINTIIIITDEENEKMLSQSPVIDLTKEIFKQQKKAEIGEYKKRIITAIKDIDEKLKIRNSKEVETSYLCHNKETNKKTIQNFCTAVNSKKKFMQFPDDELDYTLSFTESNDTADFNHSLIVEKDPTMNDIVSFLCKEYMVENDKKLNFNPSTNPSMIALSSLYDDLSPKLNVYDVPHIMKLRQEDQYSDKSAKEYLRGALSAIDNLCKGRKKIISSK